MKDNKNITFALDIGTRTVIGLILEKKENKFNILDSEVIEHDKRAMLDGQIHNVVEVSRIVKKIKERLEKRLEINLEKASIAAAGRALETITIDSELDFETKKYIEAEDIQKLEYAGIQKAQKKLAQSDPENSAGDYHFVGYSVVEYYLDDIFLKDLEGHKGKKIKAKLITTFLPQVVIDSLLSVIKRCNLEVEHLTLEPIAAASMVIPKEMYNFNLALIDIGAGTSDIAVTKGGSMIGYAMVPVAGDEVTESIAEEYMMEYQLAEKIKRKLKENDYLESRNILGSKIKIDSEKALNTIKPQVEKMVKLIGDKIKEINRKNPQALICIGGGSLTPFLEEELEKEMDIPKERIGIRDGNNLEKVKGHIENIEGTQSLTPIGIAVTANESNSEAVFVEVEVNGNNVQIFSLNTPTVSDALLTAEIDIKSLQPEPGMGLTYTLNGEVKSIKGSFGKNAKLLLNGEKAELEDEILTGDIIEFEEAEKGKDAEAKIKDIIKKEELKNYTITINGNQTTIKPKIFQNNKQVSLKTEVKDGADIEYQKLETIKDGLSQLLEIPEDMISSQVKVFYLNNKKVRVPKSRYFAEVKNKNLNLDDKIRDNLEIKLIEKENEIETVGDLLNEIDLDAKEKTINVVFNGSSLEIPANNKVIKCNDQKVDKEYELKDGDKIELEKQKITVNHLFQYINYNISESLKEDMELLINGKSCNYNDLIKTGDNIKMKLKKKQKEGIE
ncbi:MAG: cell division protein FtsA [Bacillota bacterium]